MTSLALQKGIENLLERGGGLPPVYDGVRQSAAYPYITLGRDRATFEEGQTRHQSHIFVYSQAFTITEIKKYLNQLVGIFIAASPVVEGHHLILSRVLSVESLRLSDGKTYRGELILETLIEPNN